MTNDEVIKKFIENGTFEIGYKAAESIQKHIKDIDSIPDEYFTNKHFQVLLKNEVALDNFLKQYITYDEGQDYDKNVEYAIMNHCGNDQFLVFEEDDFYLFLHYDLMDHIIMDNN